MKRFLEWSLSPWGFFLTWGMLTAFAYGGLVYLITPWLLS